jgi:hypothetical protein
MKRIIEIVKGFEERKGFENAFNFCSENERICVIDLDKKNKAIALKLSVFPEEVYYREELQNYVSNNKIYLNVNNVEINKNDIFIEVENPVINFIGFTADRVVIITREGEKIESQKLDLELMLPTNLFKIEEVKLNSKPRELFDLVYNKNNKIPNVIVGRYIVGAQKIDLMRFSDSKTYYAYDKSEDLIELEKISFKTEKKARQKVANSLTLVYNNPVNGEDGRTFNNLTFKEYLSIRHKMFKGHKDNISTSFERDRTRED